MPRSATYRDSARPERVEFSLQDALLNTWVDDSSEYLQLETDSLTPLEEPPPDQS